MGCSPGNKCGPMHSHAMRSKIVFFIVAPFTTTAWMTECWPCNDMVKQSVADLEHAQSDLSVERGKSNGESTARRSHGSAWHAMGNRAAHHSLHDAVEVGRAGSKSPIRQPMPRRPRLDLPAREVVTARDQGRINHTAGSMVPLVENGLPPAGEHQGTEDREVTGDIGTRHSDRKSQPEPEEHRWEGRVGEEQERKPLRPPPPTPIRTAAPAMHGDRLAGAAEHDLESLRSNLQDREFGKKRPLQDMSGKINFLYASYFGGDGDDMITAASAGRLRGIWIAGYTSSSVLEHRGRGRAASAHRQRMESGAGTDVFIAKLGPGGEVLHVAYIGGSGNDVVCGITDEGPDGVWVIGSTSSPDLQDVSSSAVQHRFSGVTDVMVANISPNGNLRYLSYLGGTGADSACAITRGDGGHVWVGGATDSPDLPTTSDAAKKRRGGGGSDGFLGNIGPGGHLHYMSYVSGEAGSDGITSLLTCSFSQRSHWLGGFMTMPGSLTVNALVARFDPRGTGTAPLHWVWEACGGGSLRSVSGAIVTQVVHGGTGVDRVTGLSEDPWDATIFAFGETTSASFEAEPSNSSSPPLAHADAFVAKLLQNGTVDSMAVVRGDRMDTPHAATLSAGGVMLWVGGKTTSTDLVRGDVHEQPSSFGFGHQLDGKTDAFLAKINMLSWKSGLHDLDPTGMQYYGGSGNEVVRAIVASADGTMWVVGCTDSKDLEVTSEASQTSHGGSWDGFVARVS